MQGFFVLNIILVLSSQIHQSGWGWAGMTTETIVSCNDKNTSGVNEGFVCNKGCFMTTGACLKKLFNSDGVTHRYFVTGKLVTVIYRVGNNNNLTCLSRQLFETDASPPAGLNCV